ncbi:MAG TPA: hypothetical protein VHU91_02280 [Mycobacteriales bacterium]|nr:hypothetical protein [Mycobacteriales bacterium]
MANYSHAGYIAGESNYRGQVQFFYGVPYVDIAKPGSDHRWIDVSVYGLGMLNRTIVL